MNPGPPSRAPAPTDNGGQVDPGPPSRAPTSGGAPNNAPMATPTGTRAPTGPNGQPSPVSPTSELVCQGITAEERAIQLEGQVLAISEIDTFTAGSSQEMAYQWLVSDDGLQVCPEDELDVLQRYVLAVLYFAMDGDNWFQCSRSRPEAPSNCPPQNAAFLSDVNVCLWLNVTCALNEVREISIGEFYFVSLDILEA